MKQIDENKRLTAHWYDGCDDDEIGFALQADRHLLTQLTDLEEIGCWSVGELFLDEAVDRHLGVAITLYGDSANRSYILAAKVSYALKPNPEPVDPAALADRADLDPRHRQLAAALDALGLTPLQDRPQWLIAHYYG
ncbi:hypothetical protein [Amycolatopsis rubida]|uniref:Uncharacterized protein n=1 Tax=Amycolatopsis rubida TaxID=112413 RepID=A0A1I5XJ90_9PSEU|nr:hypothetical protein [Amycolatopsis rubida]SFQ31866.1 hypothetical protein SAMN05421854_110265 [Amycolatopsis rubida]